MFLAEIKANKYCNLPRHETRQVADEKFHSASICDHSVAIIVIGPAILVSSSHVLIMSIRE